MYKTRLPSKENLFNWSAEAEECCRQVGQVSNMSDDRYKMTSPSRHFTAFFFPFCTDKNRYCVINKIMLLITVVDDHTDNQWGDVARCVNKFNEVWGQLERGLAKILNPEENLQTNSWKPYTLMLCQRFDEVCNSFNDIQKKRFVNSWMELIEFTRTETLIIETKAKMDNIEEYFKVRMKSIGLKPFLQLHEYAENVFITEQVWSNKDLQQVIDLASYCVFLCNDLHSFEWERVSFDGQLDKIESSIAVLANINNINIEEARQQILGFFVKYEELFDKKKNELLDGFEHKQSVMAWIVERVEHMVGGHYQASLRLLNSRYQTF